MNKLIGVFFLLSVVLACNKTKEQVSNDPVAFDIAQIDSSIDPCEDFYKYAIGSWQKDNPVPSTESRWMAFNILDKSNKEKLQGIINKLAALTSVEPRSEEQMIRDFYKSAMDTANLELEGLASMKPYLEEISAISDQNSLLDAMANLSKIGVKTPFNYSVSRDRKNSEKYITSLYQSGLSLPDRDYYLRKDDESKKIRTAFRAYARELFEFASIDQTTPGQRVLDFEKVLAKHYWPRVKNRNPDLTYNKNAVDHWNERWTNMQIKQSLNNLGLEQADSMIVAQPSFFRALDSLVVNAPLEEWKLYLEWQVLNSFAPHLGDRFEQSSFAFYSTAIRGTKEMKPREERILNTMNRRLGEPLGKLYVKEYFPQEAKDYMVELIENLRSAYKDRILQLSWMSDATKQKALKKLEAFTYKIGYPDKWKDYSDLKISEENYTQNVINCRSWGFNYMINKLGQPVNKTEWYMTPQMVNAYYNSSGNEIVFPAGILQPPFFHPSFDHAINYGGIGAVIGHEFSHGFDDQGSKYDWNGNLNNWWTDEDRAAFEKLADQLAKQYSAYNPIDTMHVNGRLTLGENIADLGGVTLAYAALEKAFDGEYPEPIDGYSWQQRFFLGWVNVWKGNITDEELRNRLLTDPHSPAVYRGNGPLVNFDPFYDAFGSCEHGAMYKPDSARIRIW